MATDYGYGGDAMQVPGQPSKGSGCFKGCLIAAVIAVLLAAVAGYLLWQNWRGLWSWAMSMPIKQTIDASDLPQAEKDDIKLQVDRVADAFREERMSDQQAVQLMQKLITPSFLSSIIASAAEQKYIDQSGLTDAEKAEGRQTIRRFLRGLFDDSISPESMNAAMQHIADRQPNNAWRLRDQVSDEDLRAFLEVAKSRADDAGIPDQPESFDPSDEMKRIVDEALNEN